jgi:DNA polymerase-3 subunit delta'
MHDWLEQYQQQLSHLLTQKKLPHAILLHGVKAVGKYKLASWLSQLLHCQSAHYEPIKSRYISCGKCKYCQLYLQKTHPDHQEIVIEKNTIGVDNIRQLTSFLEKKAQLGINKTIIINQAEKMTIAAANALLKTLEEPSDNSTIVLLTDDIDILLPTIISRCSVIAIRPKASSDFLSGEHLVNANDFINITQQPELLDEKIKIEYQQFIKQLLSYLYTQQCFNDVVTLFVENSHSYRWFEKLIIYLQRAQAGWQATFIPELKEELTQALQIPRDKLWAIYQELLIAKKQLKQFNQVNKQFISEKLLINCSNILIGAG